MDTIRWDNRGLIPVVVQDFTTKDVLMVAYMNEEAYELTKRTGIMHYYSRSGNKLWLKGETSGHTQEVRALYLDCDSDTLLAQVNQKVAACHTGYWSCFYRTLENGEWIAVGQKMFDEEKVYGQQ